MDDFAPDQTLQERAVEHVQGNPPPLHRRLLNWIFIQCRNGGKRVRVEEEDRGASRIAELRGRLQQASQHLVAVTSGTGDRLKRLRQRGLSSARLGEFVMQGLSLGQTGDSRESRFGFPHSFDEPEARTRSTKFQKKPF